MTGMGFWMSFEWVAFGIWEFVLGIDGMGYAIRVMILADVLSECMRRGATQVERVNLVNMLYNVCPRS